MASAVEIDAMRRALQLARRGPRGLNPQVGAVILSPDGDVLAEGFHRGAGTPHAEVDALSQLVPDAARGATAVVTLEPCNHTGRTGPCALALIDAGIGRVVYALDDPTDAAAGGADRLRAAGIDVETGPERDAAETLIHDWTALQRTGRPHVTVKWAQSLDGRAAADDGTSQWITGPAARRDVHDRRAQADAIVAGTGTVRADDPALTARADDGSLRDSQPMPVIIGESETAPDAAVRRHPREPLFYATHDLRAVLADLAEQGVQRVFVEGGPTLASAFVREGLADEVLAYIAPVLLGGSRLALGDIGVPSIAGARRLAVASVQQLGDDLLIVATPPSGRGTRHARRGTRRKPPERRRRLMFTGIVEEIGAVTAVEPSGDGVRLTLRAPLSVSDAGHGDSISVSGVCLTVVDQGGDWFTADVMKQTLDMSTLADVSPGRAVNLERATAAHGRLGGHIVQGHIDGTGVVREVRPGAQWSVVRVGIPAHLAPLVVDKGSIAIDGVSLTVSAVSEAAEPDPWLEVSLIPETLAATTLGRAEAGTPVNLETDILARHVQRMLAFRTPTGASGSGEDNTAAPAATTERGSE